MLAHARRKRQPLSSDLARQVLGTYRKDGAERGGRDIRASNRLVCNAGPGYSPNVQIAQRTPRRSYPATFTLFCWLALAGFSIAFVALLVTLRPKHGAPEALLTSQVPGAVVVTVGLMFFLQLAHCRVTASTSALVVVQPIRRYIFPWEQVADVVVRANGEMQIVLTDYRTVPVFGFGGSLIGTFTGGVQAKKARDGIKAVMAQGTIHEPARPVSSTLDIQWKIALAIWVAVTALSVVGWLLAPHHVLT